MGSPPTDPERNDRNEIPHLRTIPRRFAITAQEVSVAQSQRFMKQNPGVADIETNRYRSRPRRPDESTSWYNAAAYCNWLSRQEGLAECYEPLPGADRGRYEDQV